MFQQIGLYLLELFQQISSYLPEWFRQTTSSIWFPRHFWPVSVKSLDNLRRTCRLWCLKFTEMILNIRNIWIKYYWEIYLKFDSNLSLDWAFLLMTLAPTTSIFNECSAFRQQKYLTNWYENIIYAAIGSLHFYSTIKIFFIVWLWRLKKKFPE